MSVRNTYEDMLNYNKETLTSGDGRVPPSDAEEKAFKLINSHEDMLEMFNDRDPMSQEEIFRDYVDIIED